MPHPFPDDLRAIPHRQDVPFAKLTTLGVGGVCRWLFEPVTEAQAQGFVRACAREGLPWRTLGGGSNLVVLGDVAEPVLRLRLPPEARREGLELSAPASHGHIRLSQAAGELGLSGLEYASGIPGTVGGALHMNAGAYGTELVDVLARYRFLTPEGDLVEKSPEAGEFAYRWSVLGNGRVALGLTVRLAEGDPRRIRVLVEDYRRRRGTSQPLSKRNAGCIFKNPPGQSAGRLIDQAGLKGLRVGDAEVSPEHGNFLVNLGHATAAQFAELMARVRERVLDRYGVRLEPEVEIWAPQGAHNSLI
jgi:UDP-N-acetylmuramate dehydrogenase